MARKTVLTVKLQRAVNAGIFTPEEARALYAIYASVRVVDVPEEYLLVVRRFTESAE